MMHTPNIFIVNSNFPRGSFKSYAEVLDACSEKHLSLDLSIKFAFFVITVITQWTT